MSFLPQMVRPCRWPQQRRTPRGSHDYGDTKPSVLASLSNSHAADSSAWTGGGASDRCHSAHFFFRTRVKILPMFVSLSVLRFAQCFHALPWLLSPSPWLCPIPIHVSLTSDIIGTLPRVMLPLNRQECTGLDKASISIILHIWNLFPVMSGFSGILSVIFNSALSTAPWAAVCNKPVTITLEILHDSSCEQSSEILGNHSGNLHDLNKSFLAESASTDQNKPKCCLEKLLSTAICRNYLVLFLALWCSSTSVAVPLSLTMIFNKQHTQRKNVKRGILHCRQQASMILPYSGS